MNTEMLLADLCTKAPFLRSVIRPEYTPYLRTAGTVLLGWIVVAWISHVIWSIVAPVAVSAVAVTMVCPTTVKWLLGQMGSDVEASFVKFVNNVRSSLANS